MRRIFVVAIFLDVLLPSSASANDISFVRYYIKTFPCQRGMNNYKECVRHTRNGGLWSHSSIGIIRKGEHVCGIAHYSSAGKTDVTRFVGAMEGSRARVSYSSSHNPTEVAEAFLTLTPKSAMWEPIARWKTEPSGYHSVRSIMLRANKPGADESYIVDAKRECQEFLASGTEFERLAWEF